MEAEYSMCFDDGTEVSYFDGLPYCIDYYGDYISLDPSIYGWIDQYGYLNFPSEATFDNPPPEDLKFKGLLLTVLLGTMLILPAKGNGIINRVISMIEQYWGGSSLTTNGGLDIPYLYPAVKEIENNIVDFGGHFGVDPNLVAIIILYESGGDSSNDQNLVDVGIGQMTDVAMQTVNNDTTPEERAYVGLSGGRYATMEDIRWNKKISAGYTTLLLRYYQRAYSIDDPTVLARLYNGGPSGLDGPTGPLNEMYANHIGGLVNEINAGLDGNTVQGLFQIGRLARP